MAFPLHCPHCEIGHLHLHHRAYVSVQYEMLISVPDMPTYICDVCGYQEYERAALRQLEALVGLDNAAGNTSAPPKPATADLGDSASVPLIES